jgi:hypothetical protein
MAGSIVPSRTFAAGVERPNNAAEARAYRIARRYMEQCYCRDDTRQDNSAPVDEADVHYHCATRDMGRARCS